ncbi:MAG TPA: hypothetical protein VJI75_05660 [Candidatus Nanoarchaeia archaeon]|nr:hypothetical protein [Candidatus Nanoarchaeia archaeon]
MRKSVEYFVSERVRIVKTLNENEEGCTFALVYLVFADGWKELARIDNYPHDGTKRAHIHRCGEERVEYREMSIDEAEETLLRIGKRIKEEKYGIY